MRDKRYKIDNVESVDNYPSQGMLKFLEKNDTKMF